MKHWKKALAAFFMAATLSACGTAEGEDAAEIFKKAQEASSSLESVAMDMEMSQEITAEGETDMMGGGDISMDMTAEGKMQIDPLVLHQTMDVESAMGEMTDLPSQTIEQYVTEDAIYMTNPMNGEWMKAPQAMQEQLGQAMSADQQTPGAQISMFKDHVSDFSLEESEDSYTLSVSATGEEMEALIQSVMKDAGLDMGTEEMLKNTTINSTDISFVLQKDTHYPEKVDISMDLTVEEQGQTVNLVQDSSITYSDFNNIEELTVPEDVVKNAKEMDASLPDAS